MALLSDLLQHDSHDLFLSAIFWVLVSLIAYFVTNEVVRYRARIRGIPGPPGLPVIGNLHQLHNRIPAEQYRLWAEKYGDVFQVQLGNMPVVVVNSAASAKDLLLSQGSAMNSRPIFHVFHKVVSKSITSIGTSPWNESCKNRRKAAAGALNKAKAEGYLPILRMESKELLREILDSRSNTGFLDYHPIVQRYSLNLVLTLNYGTRVASMKDIKSGLLHEVIYVESEISKLRSTAINYSNYIPFLRIFEPFQKANAHGADIGKRRKDYNAVLLEQLRDRIASTTDNPCIQGNVLKDEEAKLSPDELTSISLSMMAGAESSTPSVEWALLKLAQTPSIQEAAYKAIQGAAGDNFDPFLTDQVDYVMAFTQEVHRYFTVLRLALPKAAYTDAIWNGHKIPQGTTVFLNSWACNRDPKLFKDAFTFSPERWLQSDYQKVGTQHYAFGYGGRMCVASHIANRALYLVFLHLLANFKILPAESVGQEFGADTVTDDTDPVKGVRDINGLAAEPRVHALRFIPRNEERLRKALA